MLGHCFLKYKLNRDKTYDRQQMLWQKQVAVMGSINLGSNINEYRTGIARFQHAVSHRHSVRRQPFAPMSLFFVAPNAYSRSFCEFFSVANVNSFSSLKRIKITSFGNSWAEGSCTAICFNQLFSRHLFEHWKPRSRFKNNLYHPWSCYLMC